MSDPIDTALQLFLDDLEREKQRIKTESKPKRGKRKSWGEDVKRFRMVRAQMRLNKADNPHEAIIKVADQLKAKRLKFNIVEIEKKETAYYQEPDNQPDSESAVRKSYNRVKAELQRYVPAVQIANALSPQSEQDGESGIDESLKRVEMTVEPPSVNKKLKTTTKE